MTIEQLIQQYSTQPDSVHLRFFVDRLVSTPGAEARSVPENALGLVGEGLLTKIEQKASHKKGQAYNKSKPKLKRYADYLLLHRQLNQVDRGDQSTPAMEGLLASVPDCAHSHLVLELNIMAFLLKLPLSVQLGAYVHMPESIELVTVQRVPELIKALLNDAYVRSRVVQSGPTTENSLQLSAQLLTPGRASDNGDAATRADSRTGAGAPGGSPADCPTPGRAPALQQVRRGLQQQELFSL